LAKTKGLKRPARLQTWVYLAEEGIGLIVLERTRQGIVRALKSLWQVEKKPIEKPDALADWVAEHCRGQLNLLLDDSSYQMMLVDVPDVPADEVEAALHFKAADLISYDLDEATIDLISLPAEAYRGRLRMSFVIAAHKPPLIAWAMAMGQRGHSIQCIDIDQLTLRNTAVRALDRDQGGLLFFEANRCRLILLFEREIVLSRQFDIGFTDLGITLGGEPELVLEGSLDIQLESLALEIRRSFDYFEAQLGLGSISDVALIGWPGAPDITETLGAKLESRFRLVHPEDFILSPTDADWPVELIPALGTAFRETLT
jgi:MSHA biogenesis protein MshI